MSEVSGYMRDVPQKDHSGGDSGDFFSYDRNEAEADGGDAAARGGDGYNRGDVDINIGGGGDAAALGGNADADARLYEEHHSYREYTERTSHSDTPSHDEHSYDGHSYDGHSYDVHSGAECTESPGAEVY